LSQAAIGLRISLAIKQHYYLQSRVLIGDSTPQHRNSATDYLQKGLSSRGAWYFLISWWEINGISQMERGEEEKKRTSNRGFASMSPEQQRAIARKGGEAVSRNREHMAAIGSRGGEAVSKDREHMAKIGRKGGERVSQDREHMKRIGRKGGERGRGNNRKKEDQGEQTMKGE
jgi:uncharacterized protein